MITRPLGKSGIEASVIAIGTWAIGGWKWGGTDRQTSIKAIHAAMDQGLSFLDTAPIYGQGLSEEIVGEAIQDRRDQVVVATKCGLRWEGLAEGEGQYFFTDDAGTRIYRWNHPDSIRTELEHSLRRLKTDYIDLYQTHWQETLTPVEDTMAVLMDLKAEGKLRAIGSSNTDIQHLKDYTYAGQLDTTQENFSMLDQQKRGHFLSYTKDHDIGFLAYSPLAFGLLSGKINPNRVFPEGDMRKTNPRFSSENLNKVANFLTTLNPWKEKYGLNTAQLVLAWTAQVPGITHVLTGMRNPDQAEENAKPAQVEISREDFNAIDNLVQNAGLDLPPPFVRKIED